MTELQLLLLIFTLIYIWECVCWISRGSVGFFTWFSRRWRIAHPALLIGNQSGGFVFAQPLPPLGTILVGNQFPLSISSDAVLAYVSSCVNPGAKPVQTGKLFKFEDIRKVEAIGKKVRVNGELLLKVGSTIYAAHVAKQVEDLLKLPPEKREAALKEMARERFDAKAITERWEKYREQIGNIRMLTNWLFAYLFVFTPLLSWRLGFHTTWPALLGGLLCITITTAIFFRRVHKTFYSDAEDDRFTHFLIVMLSPATTIRAQDILSRSILERFHPLAIAKVFCREDEFRNYASMVLRDVRHPALPVCARNEPLALETESRSRAVLDETIEEFLRKNNVSLKKLLQAPEPTDSTCVSYCPRCLTQFTTVEGKCDDCGGIPLIRFGDKTAKPKPVLAEKGE